MRLYRAICAWLEASAAALSEPQEFGPEGAGEARSEFAHDYTTAPELHRGFIPQDGSEGKVYRVPMPRSAITGRYKTGFQRNP